MDTKSYNPIIAGANSLIRAICFWNNFYILFDLSCNYIIVIMENLVYYCSS